jgi:hypothetical protein
MYIVPIAMRLSFSRTQYSSAALEDKVRSGAQLV